MVATKALSKQNVRAQRSNGTLIHSTLLFSFLNQCEACINIIFLFSGPFGPGLTAFGPFGPGKLRRCIPPVNSRALGAGLCRGSRSRPRGSNCLSSNNHSFPNHLELPIGLLVRTSSPVPVERYNAANWRKATPNGRNPPDSSYSVQGSLE